MPRDTLQLLEKDMLSLLARKAFVKLSVDKTDPNKGEWKCQTLYTPAVHFFGSFSSNQLSHTDARGKLLPQRDLPLDMHIYTTLYPLP